MKAYGITVYATEDEPQSTCYYTKGEWKDTLQDLADHGKVENEDFHKFVVEL